AIAGRKNCSAERGSTARTTLAGSLVQSASERIIGAAGPAGSGEMDGFATYRAVTPTCDKFLVNAQSGSQTMARISKELTKRCDGKTNLAPRHVIVVRVASFAFRFRDHRAIARVY